MVQRRQDGSVDFDRTWVEYEDGFGNLTGEFWYGLRALHCLTGQGGWEMRMDIMLADGTKIFLQYEQFKVASAKDKYRLSVGGFQGTIDDPMVYHHEMYFTTIDSDNDQRAGGNCAKANGPSYTHGGWWFKSCWHIALNSYGRRNGVYIGNQGHAFTHTEMKIRPFQCSI